MQMNAFQKEAALRFHDFVQLERSDVFGPDDEYKWLPKFQQEDARVMCPPFMGKNYKKGKLVILSINPGGGKAKTDVRDDADEYLYPEIHKFKGLKNNIPQHYWDTFVPNFIEATKSWKVYLDPHRGMKRILDASGTSLDDICYFNFVPFRGRDDNYPDPKSKSGMRIIQECIEKFAKPALEPLQPSLVVTFGKAVGTYIRECWPGFEYETIPWSREQAPKPHVKEEREESLRLLREWRAREDSNL